MKKIIIPAACLLIIEFVSIIGLHGSSEWGSPVISKDGINVYMKNIEGSKIKEGMGVAIINARLETITTLMRDVPAQIEWFEACIEARILKKINDDNLILYRVNKAPWPVHNRDAVTQIMVTRDYPNGRIIISSNALKDPLVPVAKGVIRMTDMTSRFVLTYIDREHTEVVMYMKVNPAGAIPPWAANLMGKKLPYNTLLGMKRMVARSKYIEAGKKSKDGREIEDALKNGRIKNSR